MLGRAGIVNIYQYGNEFLYFAGGRLLLRGVNGSGKSTAMNRLLPFLLDAHTPRIDAAGEQSGALRSWTLSGRYESQPQGYLRLEASKGGTSFSFGCGTRANRATEQVTTRLCSVKTASCDGKTVFVVEPVENRLRLRPVGFFSALS